MTAVMTSVPRQLVIFDVDGTLTRTTEVDAECFVRALALELDITPPHTDWGAYVHTTDPGIAREIFEAQLGRAPAADELARLERRFVLLLAEAFDRHPQACNEVPGAAALLARLRVEGTWDVAIATGAWRASALLKLERAGIDVAGLPAACAEDGDGREQIVRAAWARAAAAASPDAGGVPATYACVVSVGDAPWDVRTARRLGLPFLGVAVKASAGALRAAGATHVLDDFRAVGAVLRALATAEVPQERRPA